MAKIVKAKKFRFVGCCGFLILGVLLGVGEQWEKTILIASFESLCLHKNPEKKTHPNAVGKVTGCSCSHLRLPHKVLWLMYIYF